MDDKLLAKAFAEELQAEAASTRKCLERIPMELSDWKPHEKSMAMGYLALLVAEIPLWISLMIKDSEINFETYRPFQPKTTDDLVKHFDESLEGAKQALLSITEGVLDEFFYLKRGEEVLMKTAKKESISSTINHMVHHRGQLTVYMRLNDILVPSIYGPSADDKGF